MSLKLLSYFTIPLFVFSTLLHPIFPSSKVLNGYADINDQHYTTSCPQMPQIIRSGVEDAFRNDSRIGASLLRLHFLDCFVNGCDASILLDDTEAFKGEKNAFPNHNSARGYEVIDHIKTMLEVACPSIVSCADILVLAARESVYLLGGPSYTVPLGRRDGLTASASTANEQLPLPSEPLDNIIAKFKSKGFGLRDIVVLSGGHTIGFAHCSTFKGRLYNFNGSGKPDPTISSLGLSHFRQMCPNKDSSNANLAPIDMISAHRFDNEYYRNLVNNTGILQSDQAFMLDPRTAAIVREYSTKSTAFFLDFATAMVKLGMLDVLTEENKGQIRKKCGSVN